MQDSASKCPVVGGNGAKRPAEFASKAGSKRILIVFKRVHVPRDPNVAPQHPTVPQ